MFGLFRNSYDYYRWHDLICVSISKSNLRAKYKSLNESEALLKAGSTEQKDADSSEQCHYVIEPVEVV